MKLRNLIPLHIAMLSLVACGSERAEYDAIDGFAQGSTYHIVVQYDNLDRVQKGVDSLLAEIDNSISLYNKKSLLCRINSGETDSLDTHITRCIEISQIVSRESGGAYDITIKPITSAWGFTGEAKVESPNIDSLMQYVGYEKISIVDGRLVRSSPQIQIDLNASAQGYTADMLGAMLLGLGIENYLVEIGGEITCRGENSKGKSWVIGIDKPIEGNFIPGHTLQSTIELSGRALATSGNYRKFHIDENGQKIVHTIDARTGYSKISNLLSVTVIAESALLADTYSTMMMVLGVEESKAFLQKHSEIDAFFVYSDGTDTLKTYHSPELKIEKAK